jgi:hypothetical protein
MSLKVALEELGYGPCYHMVELFGMRPGAMYLSDWAIAGVAA